MPISDRNEDLFEETRMSFGEHIEELRQCLVRALYGVGIALIIGFIYAQDVVNFLQRPLEVAIRDFDQNQAKIDLEKRNGFFDPEFEFWIESQEMAPRTIRISPSQLANVTGESIEGSEQLMLAMEVLDGRAQTIAQRLIRSDSDGDPDQQRRCSAIFEQLTPEEQAAIKSLANQATNDQDEKRIVDDALNRIAAESKLYAHEAFDDLTIESKGGIFGFLFQHEKNPYPAIRQRIEEKQDQLLGVKLNRALIRHTFQAEISPPRANLVEIQIWETVKVETQSLTPHEAFMIWMKAGVFAALVLASPWIFYQLWLFISAGLYPHEKRYVHWYLPISILLFFAGVSLAFFFVMTPVLNFLFQFNQAMGISPQLRINYWLSFVMYLPIGFGVAFQLPLVMLLLNRLGLVEISTYLSKWRIAVMVIFVLSMFLTPADPMSMIMLAVPLTFLYFFGITLCKWMPRNQNPFGEVHEPA